MLHSCAAGLAGCPEIAAPAAQLPAQNCHKRWCVMSQTPVDSQYRWERLEQSIRDHDVADTLLWNERQVVNLHCGLDWRQSKRIRCCHLSRDAASSLQHMRFILCQQQTVLVTSRVLNYLNRFARSFGGFTCKLRLCHVLHRCAYGRGLHNISRGFVTCQPGGTCASSSSSERCTPPSGTSIMVGCIQQAAVLTSGTEVTDAR